MLFYFYFQPFLIHGVKSGNDKQTVIKHGEDFNEQTINPSLYIHIDLPTCVAIFPYLPANQTGVAIASHFNSRNLFFAYIAIPT